MKISKAKETFNDYKVELSWGQLNAIYAALDKDHADALADELFAELGWYLQNVPGPGEDEEEYKAAKDAEKQAIEGGEEGGGGNPDLIGQEVEGPAEPEGAESPVGAQQPEEVNDPTKAEADSFLERPPAEEEQPAMV